MVDPIIQHFMPDYNGTFVLVWGGSGGSRIRLERGERYKDVRSSTPLLMQVSLAFQCGFFWQTVFDDLTGAR